MALQGTTERPISPRNYEDISLIGRGAYGTVFKAHDMENNRTVALKRVRIANNTGDEKGVPISTLREITLLKQLDNLAHPNVVRMFDAFQEFSTSPTDSPTDTILTIVFEHVEQDLSQFLHDFPPPGLPEHLIKDLMYQLFNGIDHLHVNRLVHRDIKPQNILITRDRQVKIADFGLARVYEYNKLVTSVVVTLWYRSPEVLLAQPYATMVDIWSVGTIMAEMYNRRPIFPGKNDIDELHKILKIIGCPPCEEWPKNTSLSWDTFQEYKGINLQHVVPEMCTEGIDLLEKLLVFNPHKRLNAFKSLQHRYFKDVVSAPSDTQDSGIGSQDSGIGSQDINQDCVPSFSGSGDVNQITASENTIHVSDNDKKNIKHSSGVTQNAKSIKRTYSEMVSQTIDTCLRTNDPDISSPPLKRQENKIDDDFSGSDSGLSDISLNIAVEGSKQTCSKTCSNNPVSPITSHQAQAVRQPLGSIDIEGEHVNEHSELFFNATTSKKEPDIYSSD